MRRDMDLIRDLLLEIEGGKIAYDTSSAEEAAMLASTPNARWTSKRQIDSATILIC